MSKSWTREEIKAASAQMKKQGELSYEEFLEKLNNQKGENYAEATDAE